jgi:hypothetical protein
MSWFSPKCPYCGSKELYTKRTFPVEKYGCRCCDKKVKIMQESGMERKQIMKVIKMGK